jgi:(R,R)-butanediol dehydrogenase/meso-butanediol dehydrogenase/diacetyl reductase
MKSMEAVVYHAPHQIRVETCPIPTPPEGWVLVRVHYAGICGTDLNIYQGAHPRATGPLILGHELSGTVAGDYPQLPAGTQVTIRPLLTCGTCEPCQTGISHVCQHLKLIGIDRDGGMATYVAAPQAAVHALPDDVPLKLGAFMEPLAVGVHAVRQSGFIPGDTALVFGAGPIGMSVAASLQLLGAGRVMVAETHPFRLQMAAALGFETIDCRAGDGVKRILDQTGGRGSEFTFDCAGHPSVAKDLVQATKVQGTVVMVAAYKAPVAVDLLQVMFKEIRWQGVRVYTPKDFEIAACLFTRGFPFEQLITHVFPIQDVQRGFNLLLEGSDAVKVMVQIDV